MGRKATTDHSPPTFTLALLSCAKGRKFVAAGGAALAEPGCVALAVAEQAAFGDMLSIATSRLAKRIRAKELLTSCSTLGDEVKTVGVSLTTVTEAFETV